MDFNKVTSDLVYRGSRIQKIQMENNIVVIGDDVQKAFGFDILTSNIREDGEEWAGRATIVLDVSVENESETSEALNFHLHLEIEGEFSASKEKLDMDTFAQMLYINGGTVLYSIARSDIQNITATTFMSGKILLPMVNMIEFMREKNSEVSDK
ncbi:MAG: hypothetical protein RSD54_07895 [Ruthenibacterium sp.]